MRVNFFSDATSICAPPLHSPRGGGGGGLAQGLGIGRRGGSLASKVHSAEEKCSSDLYCKRSGWGPSAY